MHNRLLGCLGALRKSLSSSVLRTLRMGKRRGKRLLRFFGVAAREAGRGLNQVHASGYGFNLHAGVSVSARNRTKLERLLRYMARPALSNERLEKLHDGRISLRLKRPWHDGTSHLIFTPTPVYGTLGFSYPAVSSS